MLTYRLEEEMLPQSVFNALSHLGRTIQDTDWHGAQITFTKQDDGSMAVTVDVQVEEGE